MYITDTLIETAKERFCVSDCEHAPVAEHEGGRNMIFVLSLHGEKKYVLRVSSLNDRTESDYLAELEFVRYLAKNGAPVANAMESVNGKVVEKIGGCFVCLFEYAPGMLISDNGYRYRKGAPLSEYFFNTGKALGKIHRLSKAYSPVHPRQNYFEKYNTAYINALLPEDYSELKRAINKRLNVFESLPTAPDVFGLVHFDFSDGNYHIDMNTGEITVFDFDNALNCWYMFDLANLWTHGVGWYQFEPDAQKRARGMASYFEKILEGYRTETDVQSELLDKLPLFIDMVLIENVVDEFECAKRAGAEIDPEDIEDAAQCLIQDIPYAGFLCQIPCDGR